MIGLIVSREPCPTPPEGTPYICPDLGKVRFFLAGEGWGILVFFSKESVGPPSRFDENTRDPPLLGDWQKYDPPLTTIPAGVRFSEVE